MIQPVLTLMMNITFFPFFRDRGDEEFYQSYDTLIDSINQSDSEQSMYSSTNGVTVRDVIIIMIAGEPNWSVR